MSVNEFKTAEGFDTIRVKSNPKTGKLFFVGTKDGVERSTIAGGVASWPIDKPVVSKVQGTPTEQNPSGTFFLLHKQGTGAPALAEL